MINLTKKQFKALHRMVRTHQNLAGYNDLISTLALLNIGNAEKLLRNVEDVGEEYSRIWEICHRQCLKNSTPSIKERLQDYKLRRVSAEIALKLADDEFQHSFHCTCWQCEAPF